MAYIEAHQSLRDHRKILALAAELDMAEPHVAGHCVYLWLWSLDNAPDGMLPESHRIIERAAAWIGVPGTLVAAMIAVGMLDQGDDGHLYIHDWFDYAGRLIEKRKSDAERKRQERANKGLATPVRRTSKGRPRDGAGTVPNRTVTNHTTPSESAPTSAAATPPSSDVLPQGAPEVRVEGESELGTAETEARSSPTLRGLPPRQPDEAERDYWERIVKAAAPKERTALLVRLAHDKINVDDTPGGTGYARIGALASRHHAGNVLVWIFQAAAQHITGDPLDYLTTIANRQQREARNGTGTTTGQASARTTGTAASGGRGSGGGSGSGPRRPDVSAEAIRARAEQVAREDAEDRAYRASRVAASTAGAAIR